MSAYFRDMEKEQYQSLIRLFFIKGKSLRRIKNCVDAVSNESFPSMNTSKNWFHEFQASFQLVFDEPRASVPKAATTEENVKKFSISY